MAKPILTINGLTKKYGENIVFHDIDMIVNEGDTIVIIGPSGTGKSTLLRCINLPTRANEGQIWLDDEEITAKNCNEDLIRQHIGMVFQNFLLFNHLTALENVRLGLSRRKAHESSRCSYESHARIGKSRTARPRRALPRTALWWAATASCDCTRTRNGSAYHVV